MPLNPNEGTAMTQIKDVMSPNFKWMAPDLTCLSSCAGNA